MARVVLRNRKNLCFSCNQELRIPGVTQWKKDSRALLMDGRVWGSLEEVLYMEAKRQGERARGHLGHGGTDF